MIAVMYNKKKPVLEADIEKGTVKRINRVLNKEYAPLYIYSECTEKKLNEWLNKRRMPADREGMPEVSERFSHFAAYPGFDSYGCMFSLSDQYWFCFDKHSQTWGNGNYFTNPYSEDIGKAFFTPWEYPKNYSFKESPDLMTNGLLCKRWTRIDDGASYMIKAGSRHLRQEPISEVLASIMLKKLNIIPFVEYELVVEGMRLCSRCRNFVTKDTEFVPASHIYYQGKKHENESVCSCLLRMCKRFNIKNAKRDIEKMITVDTILGNEDRHLGNFGFIRNVETLEFVGFAPLFDSGYSFVSTNRLPNDKRIVFTEKEKQSALAHNLRYVNMEKLEEHNEMFDLIDVYPEIDEEERHRIKKKIISAPGNIRRLTRTLDKAPIITR